MSNGSAAQARALDSVTDKADVTNEGVGLRSRVLAVGNASGGDAVEVLAADRDTSNEAVELAAVLVDGLLKSLELGLEGVVAGGCPEAEKNVGLGLDGSRDSRDGVVGRSALLLEEGACKSSELLLRIVCYLQPWCRDGHC